jgi:hypothetical protein
MSSRPAAASTRWRFFMHVIVRAVASVAVAGTTMLGTDASAQAFDPGDDAVRAAPSHHRVMLENEDVRVLDVTVQPGVRQPFHNHRFQSLFYLVSAVQMLNWVKGREEPIKVQRGDPYIRFRAAEASHAVENLDTAAFRAIRIELKRAPSAPETPRATPAGDLWIDNAVVAVRPLATSPKQVSVPSVVIFGPTSSTPEARWVKSGDLPVGQNGDFVVTLKYLTVR